MENLPYAQRVGTLEKMLDKIKTASVPDKFSQDFVSTKLSMKGGTPRSTIPFIKKMGFVTSDGTPTKRYTEFRNDGKSGKAIADSLREVYRTLFEMNEYVYELDAKSLKNLIVEATGAQGNSTPVQKTLATFGALNKLADFDAVSVSPEAETEIDAEGGKTVPSQFQVKAAEAGQITQTREGINLSYTINLNLPPTTDIEVFNAIFKSLKQHLLQE